MSSERWDIRAEHITPDADLDDLDYEGYEQLRGAPNIGAIAKTLGKGDEEMDGRRRLSSAQEKHDNDYQTLLNQLADKGEESLFSKTMRGSSLEAKCKHSEDYAEVKRALGEE